MKLKKLLFSAAALAALGTGASMLAPGKASALPAFARQTGAACLSCHFQTFPSLNAFGRSFMMNSFTDVGDQALVEDENLSIPAVLNATFQVRANATTTKTNKGTTTTYTIPDKAMLFIAGRVGSNTGVFLAFSGGQNNVGMGSLAGTDMNMGPAPIWMVLNSWDVGDFKMGLSAHKSPWGGSNTMEVSNVFGHRGDKLGGQDITAISNAGFTQMTTGIGTWIGNDMGYLQFSLVAPAIATTGVTNVGVSFGKLIRAVATLDVAGWDTLIGVGYITGSAGKGGTVTGTTLGDARIPMNLQFIDAQMQGEIGDMSLGIYADWAHAKGKTNAAGYSNFYGSGNWLMNTTMGMMGAGSLNSAGRKYDGYSIRAELEPVNRFLVGIGYGYRKLSRGAATGDLKTTVFHLAATYKVYQNFDLNLIYNNEREDDAGTVATNRSTVFEALIMM